MESMVDGNSGDVRKTKCGQRERPKAWSVKDTKRSRRERQSMVNKTDESVVKGRDKAWCEREKQSVVHTTDESVL